MDDTQNRGNLYPRKFDEEFDGQDYFVVKDYPEKSNEPEFNFERRLLKRSNNIYEDAISRLLKRSNPNHVYEKAVLGLLKRSTDNIYNAAITRSL